MKIADFRALLISTSRTFFSDVPVVVREKTKIALEARIRISNACFIEVYYNSLTIKKSYALVKNGERIFGYDNFKYWHVHPVTDPSAHLACEEPAIEKVFEEMGRIVLDQKV